MLKVSRDINLEYIEDFPLEERFIKLPIKNYLNIIKNDKGEPVDAIRPQIALINAINNPKYRAIVAALSRRTGKTFIANIIAQLITFVPLSHVLIMSPNYSLSQISWDLQRLLLKKFEIKPVKANAKDKVIELENGSSVRMGSVGQADSVVGRSYDLILFDEAALDDRGKDVYNIQLRPTLDKDNSKVIFISTPRGKNYFHEFFQRGFSDDFPEWVSIHSDYMENPRVSLKDIEQARRGMSSAEFDQEYLADFVAMQGQIYAMSPGQYIDINVKDIEVWDVIAGLDVGFRDATAFCVILTDGNNFYIVDEYQSAKKTTAGHAREIKKRMDKWNVDFVYIDSAAAQTKFDLAMNFDISCVNANKSKLDGIGYVASIVEHNRLYVDNKCKHTRTMLEEYTWDDREGLLNERPKKGGPEGPSHMADAVRYAMYTHAYNQNPL